MSDHGDSADDLQQDRASRAGPRFVPAPPQPVAPTGDEVPPALPLQPAEDAPRQDPDLFTSRYVPFDGPGAGSTEPLRPAVPRSPRATTPRRRQRLTGSRYVPIDGAAALDAQPSKLVLMAALIAAAASVVLAVLWGNIDVDGPTAGSLVVRVAGALAIVTLVVWRLGTARMAALTLLICAGLFSGVALGAVIVQGSDDTPNIGPSALEDDFDLLYGRCQDDNDAACDLLYRGSWEGSVRSSLAQELTRDCGGRGLAGEGFCTTGLFDRDLDGLADAAAPGWPAIAESCQRGDMVACDLALAFAPSGSELEPVAGTCGGRRPASSDPCRTQFGATASD